MASEGTPTKIPSRLTSSTYFPSGFFIKDWIIAKNVEQYGDQAGTVPWELSMKEALDEIKLSMAAGISKSLFTLLDDGNISANKNCHIKGLSPGCVSSVLNGFSDAIMARERLDEFTTAPCITPTLQRLRAWISTFLMKWKERVFGLRFERLLQCVHMLRPLLNELLIVYTITAPFLRSGDKEKFDVSSVMLTSCFSVALSASISFESHCTETRIASELLCVSLESPIHDISKWICGKEFPAAGNLQNGLRPDIESNTPDGMRYQLHDMDIDLVAGSRSVLIAPIVGELISARKCAIILRQLEQAGVSVSCDESFKGCNFTDITRPLLSRQCSVLSPVLVFHDHLQEEIRRRCLTVSRALVSALREQLHLDILFKELRGTDAASLRRFCDILNETFHSNYYAGSFKFHWRFNVVDGIGPEKMPGIQLRCQIPWPLDMVVTERHMDSYSKMLRLFFGLESARIRVARLDFCDLAPSGLLGRRLSIQRFQLFVFLTRIVAAISYEFFGRFDIDSILAVSSMDEVYQKHDKMVATLLTVTLSDDRSAAWGKLMSKMTVLSREVQEKWTDGLTSESDLANFRLTFDSSQHLFDTVLSTKYKRLSVKE